MKHSLYKKITKVLIGLAVIVPVYAETWMCKYDGTWSAFNSAEKGKFTWNMSWEGKTSTGWEITGDYNDHYGTSSLNGQCNRQTCELVQIYHSGRLNGKRYFWKGNYADKKIDSENTMNQFEGTWGHAPGATDGLWRATATCGRVT